MIGCGLEALFSSLLINLECLAKLSQTQIHDWVKKCLRVAPLAPRLCAFFALVVFAAVE